MRIVGLTAVAVAALLPLGQPGPALAAGECLAPDANGLVKCTFHFTGAPQYWVVPDGISSITYDVPASHACCRA